MDKYEDFENTLDPHRVEERAAAAAEVATRLRDRGVAVTGGEKPEELVDLLSAVERFEAAVEAHGGDLMVDDLKNSQPGHPHLVFPLRPRTAVVRANIGPIPDAAVHLRQPP